MPQLRADSSVVRTAALRRRQAADAAPKSPPGHTHTFPRVPLHAKRQDAQPSAHQNNPTGHYSRLGASAGRGRRCSCWQPLHTPSAHAAPVVNVHARNWPLKWHCNWCVCRKGWLCAHTACKQLRPPASLEAKLVDCHGAAGQDLLNLGKLPLLQPDKRAVKNTVRCVRGCTVAAPQLRAKNPHGQPDCPDACDSHTVHWAHRCTTYIDTHTHTHAHTPCCTGGTLTVS